MNKELWNNIYDTHFPTLLKNMTGRMRGDKAGAEDIVQNTFIKLMEKYPDDADTIESVGGLLQVSAMRLCISEYRKSLIEGREEIDLELLPDHNYVEQTVIEVIRDEMLKIAIKKISPEFIDTMTLLVAGYGYQEIADKLKIPIGTVSARISKAKAQLRKMDLFV